MVEESDDIVPCENCDGSGIRAPVAPSCPLPDCPEGWVVVERCDYCDRYPDDLEAASVIFAEVRWTQCASGGWHALGKGEKEPVGACETPEPSIKPDIVV
jgi:hypothetical protein